jgi:ComF family protein
MNFLYDLLDDLSSLLFPRLCFACGNHLVRNEELICTSCYLEIPRTGFHLYENNPVEQLFWGRCMITRAAAFSFYTRGSRIRKLIHNLKYRGIKEIGTELGRIYGSALKNSDFLAGVDVIIPVPLHPAKKRLRGFNQCDFIANGIAEVTALPVDNYSLVRTSRSDTQTKRSRYDRWMNVEGIFSVENPEMLSGKHILIIDDVITTGSTIEACAGELLKIENVKVSVIALAVAVM